METANFRKTLIDIARNEPIERLISKTIAFYYPRLDLKDKSTFFDSLMNLLSISEKQTFDFNELIEEIEKNQSIINPDTFKNKDYRIKNIKISNLRGVPSIQESESIPYGISLIENDLCQNAIVLANNGTGKSSLFAGLEMIYANEIGEKKLRTQKRSISETEYFDYLKRFPLHGKPVCSVETFEGEHNLDNKIFPKEYIDVVNPISHFITEFDIIENGRIDYETSEHKLDYSFHNIIAKALGLNEFLDLLTITEQIPTYSRRKEIMQQNKIKDEIKSNEETIKNRLALIQSKQIELDELVQGEETISNRVNKIDLISELRRTIEETPTLHTDSSKLKDAVDEYQKAYQEYFSASDIQFILAEKGFLEQGLRMLDNKEDCPFCQESKKTIVEIKENVLNRINNLTKYEETERRIKLAFRNLTNDLFDSMQALKHLSEKLFDQRSVLSKHTYLDGLLKREVEMMDSLTPRLLDDELLIHLKVFTGKQFPADLDFNSLSKFLVDNEEFVSQFLPSKIDEVKLFTTEREKQIQQLISMLADTSEITLSERIKALKKEIDDNRSSIPILETRINELNLQLKSVDQLVHYSIRIKEEIKYFNLKLLEEKDKIVKKYFETIKEVVEKIMNDFIDEKERITVALTLEKIERKIDGEVFNTEIIMAKLIQEDGKITTPDIYFNTFRYKVFCLMISLSIALSSRMRWRVNLPLVMDDLFFASDFISKNSFSVFLQKIIELFYKYTPDVPFQFILFTHDDLIFRSALDAIDEFPVRNSNVDYCAENKIPLSNKTLVARMFSLEDKETPDIMNDGSKYWNLLYTIPKEVQIYN